MSVSTNTTNLEDMSKERKDEENSEEKEEKLLVNPTIYLGIMGVNIVDPELIPWKFPTQFVGGRYTSAFHSNTG